MLFTLPEFDFFTTRSENILPIYMARAGQTVVLNDFVLMQVVNITVIIFLHTSRFVLTYNVNHKHSAS